MGWSIGKSLGAVGRFGARIGEWVATSTPVLAVAPQTADKVDHYWQGITAPSFPRRLEPARPKRFQPTPASLGPVDLAAPGATASYGLTVSGTGTLQLPYAITGASDSYLIQIRTTGSTAAPYNLEVRGRQESGGDLTPPTADIVDDVTPGPRPSCRIP